MKRDLNRLGNQHYDVLIIGGGIYGAAIAREIAIAGMQTALVEQKDFSHATSANSLKIIHGGFRYLQYLDIRRMRESIKSRRTMMKVAPHLVRPLKCIMPTYGYGKKGKEAMRIALILNELISYDRNRNLDSTHYLPRGKILSKEQCLKNIPYIQKKGLRGACLWYDALAMNTERLTLEFIREATKHGACVANYLKAKELILRNGRVVGIKAQDELSGEELEIMAHLVVDSTGPWVEKVLQVLTDTNRKQQFWAKAINIVIKKPLFFDVAVGLEGSHSYTDSNSIYKNRKRLYFFVPWRGSTIIGTKYKPYEPDSERLSTGSDEIIEFIDEVNAIYPHAALELDDVTFFHAGLLPMAELFKRDQSDIQLDKCSKVIDHEKKNHIKGLLSVKSVKYTTAPQIAKKVKRIVCQKVRLNNFSQNAFKNYQKPLNHQPTPDMSKDILIKNHESEIVKHFKSNYGQYASHLMRYLSEEGCSSDWISNDPPVTTAEIIYSIREEMALKLSDIVFRRTGLGAAECPPLSILNKVADIAAKELGWNHIRKAEEVKDVLVQYSPLQITKDLDF